VVLALSPLAVAQHSPALPDAARENIQMERMRAQAMFQAQELACQQKFAVTDCSRKVELQRREHAARMRSEEEILNDQDRQRRALQALQANEQRALERAQEDAKRSTLVAPARKPDPGTSDTKSRSAEKASTARVPKEPAVNAEQAARNRAAFDAKQKNDMIELLETLHRKGLNVWASLFGRTKHSRQNQYITLFKSPESYPTREYDMYDLNAPRLPDYNHNLMKSDSYLVTEPGTSCFPKSIYHELMVDLIIPHQYRINVCVFNIEWDMLQADKIVLESIRELKQCM
jgi:hypothetical protein